MPWLKALHIIALVAWFAGLFYLPRLFVYHADCEDAPGKARFRVMERRLLRAIMTPAAVVTVGSGLWLLVGYWSAYGHAGWMHAKLTLVLLLVAYHLWCWRTVGAFARDERPHGARFYRLANEFPTLILIGVVILVEVRPF